MPSLLEYKDFKSMPDSVKKQIIKEKIERYLAKNPHCRVVEKERYKKTQASPEEPLSEEREVSDTIIDTKSVSEELKDSKAHGGPITVLVDRLERTREE